MEPSMEQPDGEMNLTTLFPLDFPNFTTSSPSSCQAPVSFLSPISQVSLHQITVDYRIAIGDDNDFDGIKNGDESAASMNDADWDDDGLVDGLDPDWHTPDKDGDALPDGLERGVIHPIMDIVTTSGTIWGTNTSLRCSPLL